MNRMSTLRQRTRNPRRPKTRGQTLVEFALVLPIFLLVLFGIIDAGRLVYQNTTLSQAAREGARLASVEVYWLASLDPSCNNAGGPVCPADTAALIAHATAAANRMTAPFGTVQNLYLSCDASIAPTGAWTKTAPLTCPNHVPNQSLISVRVTSTFQAITPIISSIFNSISLSGSATMVAN
jgi:Flp pilus assembly protein TadG